MKTATLIVQPLSEEERLSWAEHKIDFEQFARGAMRVILALVDCKKRRLYREEYGDISWDKFLRKAPWFNPGDWSRQRKSQFKLAADTLEQMSTNVDNQLLAGLTEGALRTLRACVANPNWRGELVTFMNDNGVKPGEITEATIDRFYPQFLQAKEEEDERRKETAQLGSGSIGISSDADEDEEEEKEEKEEEQKETELKKDNALCRSARKTEKRLEYFARFLEYLRMSCKNARKICATDLETEEAQQAMREALDRADEVFAHLRSFLRLPRAAALLNAPFNKDIGS